MSFPTQIDIFISDREILVELFRNQNHRVHIYILHEKYGLSPAQVAGTLRKFEPLGIMKLSGYWIELTEFGSRWLLANRMRILGELTTCSWKAIPHGMRAQPQKTDEHYVPKRKRMGKHFFEDMEQINKLKD